MKNLVSRMALILVVGAAFANFAFAGGPGETMMNNRIKLSKLLNENESDADKARDLNIKIDVKMTSDYKANYVANVETRCTEKEIEKYNTYYICLNTLLQELNSDRKKYSEILADKQCPDVNEGKQRPSSECRMAVGALKLN